MEEIIITTQAELDAVSDDYNGIIKIKSSEEIEVRKRYKNFVTACDTSTVTACSTSTVTACGTSTVRAYGNSQILNMQSDNSHIAISNNARIIHLPRNIEEYISYYNLTTENSKIKLYKAVKREEDHFCSFYDNSFKYYIGETATEICSDDIQVTCANGIHVAHLDWAIKFGMDKGDFAIIEVESDIDKIVVPHNTDGKVRTSEIRVIREVPPEEWR